MTGGQQDMFENPLNRARELKARRQYAEAEQILEQELAKNPQDRRAKASLADLLYRTGRHKEALTLAGEILRDHPDDPRALLVTGTVLAARKKKKEALEHLGLALRVTTNQSLRQRILAAIQKTEAS